MRETNDTSNDSSDVVGGGVRRSDFNLRSSVDDLSLRIIEAHREFKKVMTAAKFQANEAARILKDLQCPTPRK